MSFPKHLDQVPPFPSDVPIADITTFSLKKLEAGDRNEGAELFQACCDKGFFYLDLRDSSRGSQLMSNAGNMFDLTLRTLNEDKQVLRQFAHKPPADLLGYKEVGTQPSGDGVDNTEAYSLSQDDLLGTLPRRNPQPIEESKSECRDFIQRAYATVAVVLGVLDTHLGLPQGTLAELTAPEKRSATALRLLLSRPQIPTPAKRKIATGAHTDIGIITMLFHGAGGLQLLPPGQENVDENWRYVRPQQGCVLLNLGDTFAQKTGDLFCSGLHRVVTPPGEQGRVERVTLAYLIRPADGETMRRLRGNGSVVPPVQGEDDTRKVEDWATERTYQAINLKLRPRTFGGIAVATH